ncbi:phage tail assembly chaperone [Vibrio metschnikovii]|uniref:phage tail assembly chaperone n=1 Tax=Vibrio metschnikovii TaxID=28172 RepID=UPI001302317C|nr:phage tail assembly chaperone [Vibrio metschnikovii]
MFKNIKTAEDLEREKLDAEAARVRSLRDMKLRELDNFVMNPLRWMELSEDERQALAEYRRKLLDVTDQEGFPLDVELPEVPDLMNS